MCFWPCCILYNQITPYHLLKNFQSMAWQIGFHWAENVSQENRIQIFVILPDCGLENKFPWAETDKSIQQTDRIPAIVRFFILQCSQPCSPDAAILSFVSYPGCTIPSFLFGFPFPVFLSRLSCSGCLVPILSQ